MARIEIAGLEIADMEIQVFITVLPKRVPAKIADPPDMTNLQSEIRAEPFRNRPPIAAILTLIPSL
jgi:hypothetical protein